ncbi:MAG: OpgC domain-containing protein [Chloroflexi bacterium]|nr:OpgC domain-containing protein [Chloroflexota bacterium]
MSIISHESILTLPRVARLNWAYAVADKRDLRIDLLRGFAVFVMVVNHFGGASWLYYITGNNSFFVSGAEAFVFISGVVVGMVYGGIALKQGLSVAQRKAFERAWTLYKLTIILTLLLATVSTLFRLPWADSVSIDNPLTFLIDVLLLRQTFYLSDVMLLYTFLMVAAVGALWLLLTGRTGWLQSISVMLWGGYQLYGIDVSWHIQNNTTFNLAAWQLLFFVGMAIGYHRETLKTALSTLPRLPYLILSALLMAILVQIYSTEGVWSNALFLKSAVAPGRLLASVIVFQFAYLMATMLWKPIFASLGWLLMPLGQNALYAYTIHIALIGIVHIVNGYLPINLAMIGTLNTSLQIMTVLTIWAMIRKQFLFNLIPR